MRTIKLKVDDDIYKNIMLILTNLKVKGLEIEAVNEEPTFTDTKEKMKNLFEKKNIEVFSSISDPMQWQEKQRDE